MDPLHASTLVLLATLTCVCCFKSSCLHADSSRSDNISVLQCVEDAVAIEWNVENDVQYIAFEYSCIHPTNSSLSVLNQSFPFLNDGHNGRTTITPLASALCLFSACYLDQDDTRHYVAPTSCITTPSAANGASSEVMVTTNTSYITETPRAKELSMATSLRDGRAVSHPPQLRRNVRTPFVAAAATVLVVAALFVSVTSAVFIVRAKRHSLRATSNQHFTLVTTKIILSGNETTYSI